MMRYVFSIVGGFVLGTLFLAGSSCVGKKQSVVDGVDAGVQVVGTMTVGTPTVNPVNPQITDSVTQVPPAVLQSAPEKK